MTRTIPGLLLIIFFVASAHAQSLDSLLMVDTARTKKFVPTGLRVGTDMISLVRSQLYDDFNAWEVSADVDVHRYIVSVDFGSWRRNFSADSAGSYSSTYRNDGHYWRIGIDANFLTRDPERNAFFLGLRHGQASYSEYMSVMATDTIWGPRARDYVSTGVKARWFELTAGLKVKMWKFIWMGYTGSLKLGLKTDENAPILSHDVPGYGRTDKDTGWGFTYQIFFRIPFRPVQSILPPKKK